jgi:hypothetical protein
MRQRFSQNMESGKLCYVICSDTLSLESLFHFVWGCSFFFLESSHYPHITSALYLASAVCRCTLLADVFVFALTSLLIKLY